MAGSIPLPFTQVYNHWVEIIYVLCLLLFCENDSAQEVELPSYSCRIVCYSVVCSNSAHGSYIVLFIKNDCIEWIVLLVEPIGLACTCILL